MWRKNRFLESLNSRGNRPLVVAHRGDSFFTPENPLEAARRARDGADAWELDVQLTRDGIPVVLHDDSLLRTTDVVARFGNDLRSRSGFLINDFTYSELMTLDAGSWFLSENSIERSATYFGTLPRIDATQRSRYTSGTIRIPRLVDALRLTAELDWLVNVEIKAFPLNPQGLTEAVLNAIAETETADRVLISSFDHRIIAGLSRSRPNPFLAYGLLTHTPLYDLPRYAAELVGCSTVHVSAESLGSESAAYRNSPSELNLMGEGVEALNAHGIPVLVYTVNEHGPSSLASRLAGIGVAGIFTDDPRGMARSFQANTTPDRVTGS